MVNRRIDLNDIEQLKALYKTKKREILKRLEDFKKVWGKSDNEIFSELCFCILTAQAKAEVCDKIINKLKRNKLLFWGSVRQIMPYLKKARFYKNKSKYIVKAREFFKNKFKIKIKAKLESKNIFYVRDWLAENVKGLGYKEASHFLRNIGFGENLAVLDVHILKNLKKIGVIETLPKSLTKKRYLEIEDKFKKFADKIKIPIAHLDLLFWSTETGKIFK